MRIERVKIKDFQGVRGAEITLGALTMIHGVNGSGKTSIGDAIAYALTGQQDRGRVLASAIREGAKALDVEVTLDSGTIHQRRTQSAGKSTPGDVAGFLWGAYELEVKTIAAALRSGRILELTPVELHDLFLDLCGGEVDADAIHEALGDAAGAIDAYPAIFTAPKTMEDLPRLEKKAVETRQQAKRDLDRLRGDLARLPEVEEPEHYDLPALRKRREEAVRSQAKTEGATQAKLEDLQKHLATLEALEVFTEDDQKNLADHNRRIGEMRASIRALEGMILKIDGELGDLTPGLKPAKDSDAIAEELRIAREEAVDLRESFAEVEEEGKRIASLLSKLTDGKCPTCEQDAQGLAKSLEAQKKDAGIRWKKTKGDLEAAETRVVTLEGDRDWHQAQALRKTKAEYEASIAEQQAKLGELEAAADLLIARKGELSRRASIPAVKAEIASIKDAMGAEAGEDLAALDEEISRAEAAAEAGRVIARRAELENEIRSTEALIEAADTVATACGPKGAPATIMGQLLRPLLEGTDAALAAIWPGAELRIETEGGLSIGVAVDGLTLAPSQLSDGERTRLLYALQSAVGELSGVRLLILDRVELIDGAAKRLVMRWVSTLTKAKRQVLILTTAPAPEAAPPGVVAYAMAEGKTTRVQERKTA